MTTETFDFVHVPGCDCAAPGYRSRLRQARRAVIATAITDRAIAAVQWYVGAAEDRLREARRGASEPVTRRLAEAVLAGGTPDSVPGARSTWEPGAAVWAVWDDACFVAQARGWGDAMPMEQVATLVRMFSPRTPRDDLRHAQAHVPNGSCLAWLDAHPGPSWPGDHRAYHVLALYEIAMRRHGTATERASVEALSAALQHAPWGAQPEGSFITRRSRWIASSAHVSTLHAPGKQGPLAEVADDERGDGCSLVALRTREEARAIREAERARNRARAETGRAVLIEVDAGLRAGRTYRYSPGQRWGTLCVREGVYGYEDAAYVAALPALRRAGVGDPEGALTAIMLRLDREEEQRRARGEDIWIGLGPALVDPGEQGPRVTLRAQPARVRRLPAMQRAQVAS
jgi:hypothetical protein